MTATGRLMAASMNVNVMRIAFRSLLTATNNVHKCASSGRSYSKKGIANKFCLLCFVAVNGSMRSMVCLSWLLCYNKLVSSAEEKFNYWKADCLLFKPSLVVSIGLWNLMISR